MPRFIETSIFTRDVQRLLSDEEYRRLQLALLLRPEQGRIIPGSGGLRKMRWKMKCGGKRGGIRVIYYLIKHEEALYMLRLYEKSRQDDLTPVQLRILQRLVREEWG